MNKKAPPGASRPAPPQVIPVEHAGVRYQEDDDALRYGGNQSSGYFVATDTATGQRLWHLKVYEVPTATRPGAPNFGRHFRRMTLADGGNALEVENEVGGVYGSICQPAHPPWCPGPIRSANEGPRRDDDSAGHQPGTAAAAVWGAEFHRAACAALPD